MIMIDREGLLRELSAFVDDIARVVEGVEPENDQRSNLEHIRLIEVLEQARQQNVSRVENILSYLFLPACKDAGVKPDEPRYWVEVLLHADLPGGVRNEQTVLVG